MCVIWLLEHLKYLKASNYLFSSAGYIFISNDTSDDDPSVFLLNQLVRCSWRAYFLRNTWYIVLSVFEYHQVHSNLRLFHPVVLTLPPAVWVVSTPLSVQCAVSAPASALLQFDQTNRIASEKRQHSVWESLCLAQWSMKFVTHLMEVVSRVGNNIHIPILIAGIE